MTKGHGGTLRSGELAARAGVSVDTLRHYEKVGVLQPAPRSGNGYREYPESVVERIAAIRTALSVGFTLEEIARFFAERRSGRPPCRSVRALAADKLAVLDDQIAALTALRSSLQKVLEEWDERLGMVPAGEPASLIESLHARSRSAVRTVKPRERFTTTINNEPEEKR